MPVHFSKENILWDDALVRCKLMKLIFLQRERYLVDFFQWRTHWRNTTGSCWASLPRKAPLDNWATAHNHNLWRNNHRRPLFYSSHPLEPSHSANSGLQKTLLFPRLLPIHILSPWLLNNSPFWWKTLAFLSQRYRVIKTSVQDLLHRLTSGVEFRQICNTSDRKKRRTRTVIEPLEKQQQEFVMF